MNTLYVNLDEAMELVRCNCAYDINSLPTIDLSIIDTMIEEIEDSNLAGQYIVQKVNALQELKSRLLPKN
ncbi:hypothetical protein KBD33_06290 [Candidatus Gracilibacteria bacterium]|nr:hypothetical protein [Candidatus Gracilibacteria bacterium]